MKIALFQGTADPLNLQHNLKMIDRAAEKASSHGADLMLTPELFATGYAPALIKKRLSQRVVSETAKTIANIARKHKLALVFSLPGPGTSEQRGIWVTLVDTAGEVLADYQKVQLFGPEEKAAFKPGVDPPPVVSYHGLRIGLMICYDVEFPELVRTAALSGADLLLVPTALGVGAEEVSRTLVPARAQENRITIAYANHTGTGAGSRFSGGSVIAGPLGHLITAGTEPNLLFAEVSPAPAPGPDGPWYLEDRRGGLYRDWFSRIQRPILNEKTQSVTDEREL